jgi:large subunit ribosomal protein L23
MVKVWFPSMFMKLINVNRTRKPAEALLHVPPSMTKTEVKEYLTKIYDIPVLRVTTTNVLGKWKRLYGKRQIVSYKRRNFKKATVQFGEPLEAGTGGGSATGSATGAA